MASYQQMIQQMQKMQREYEKAQKVLDETTFENTTNGVVKIVMKGNMEIVSIEFLDKDVLEDGESLAEMIKLAYNGCRDKINNENDKLAERFQGLSGNGMF